ncbi:MAG: tripartite tricarboxylate transporter substrate binding protein [Deltaproteobacteria bacterium]|jgi:tripartite-type tricarboxylate transporter receptor subunit TctC|nr:tripartite tricarboxylate transporter substrate binding protein [Deltaproteobacteria bacterium]
MRKSLFTFVFFAVICVVAGPPVAEAAYPNKPITVTQGFKAGGGSDALAQVTQPTLQRILGQSFVNQYIPGATGAIAWTKLAKSTKADGYTLSITNTPMLQANYIMSSEIKYNIRELDPIANVVTDPGILVVGKDSPFKTYQDYAAAVKANPGKITVGNSGVGGDDFFSTIQWMKLTGLKVAMVPFEGDGPSWQAAAGGKIDASDNNLGITFPHIKAGTLRALAIFAETRYPDLPDVPTYKELGINLIAGSSRGYSAPKGLPKPVKDKLIDAFKKMAADPEFIKACNDRALVIDMHYGDGYMKFLTDEEKLMQTIWDDVKKDYTKQQ